MSNKNKGAQAAHQLASNQAKLTPASEKQQSGDFVTVMSKLPWGLSFVTPDGKVHKINGMNQGLVVKMEGLGGLYASTRLSKAVWAYFAKVNSEQPYLKKKIIFAHESAVYAIDQAKEIEKDSSTYTGMEQVDPNKIKDIKKAEEVPNGAGAVL